VTTPRPDPRRLLFIDDELVPGQTEPTGNYMWYYTQAFRDAGYLVSEAGTTDDALRILREAEAGSTRFDLVVIDVRMPPGECLEKVDTQEGGRTGLHMADKIMRSFPGTPIVVLTNQTGLPALRQHFQATKPLAVLSKYEFTPKRLTAEVNGLLGP
jgi:CheY-like chemotaxis protein